MANSLDGFKTTEIVDAGLLLRFLYADNLLKPVSIKQEISKAPDLFKETNRLFLQQPFHHL